MGIKLPDLQVNGVNNRIKLVRDGSSFISMLRKNHSFMLINCGNPLHKANFNGQNSSGTGTLLNLIGNEDGISTNSRWGLSYIYESGVFNLKAKESFSLGEDSISVFSKPVTLTNCEWIYIERSAGNFRIDLLDKELNVTTGDTLNNPNFEGLIQESSSTSLRIGGRYSGDDSENSLGKNWRTYFSHLLAVESDSPLTGTLDKIKTFINDGQSPQSLWPGLIKAYSPFTNPSDLSCYSDYNVFTGWQVESVTNNLSVSSEKVSSSTDSVILFEDKEQIVGCAVNDLGIINADITINGSYSGTVTGVEARLLDSRDLTVLVDWQVIDASPLNNEWSGTFSNVEPNIYYVEVRPSNNPTAVYEGRNDWWVAPVFTFMGQSQLAYLFGEMTSERLGNYESINEYGRTLTVMPRGKFKGDDALYMRDADYLITAAWQKVHGDTPLIITSLISSGQGHDYWLTNTDNIFGDGSYNSGQVSNVREMLGTDKINLVYQWGTDDMSVIRDNFEDYKEMVRGLVFNAGVTYSGSSYYHLSDYFDIQSFGLSPLTMHDETGVDVSNYVGQFNLVRRKQIEFWQGELACEFGNRVFVGQSANNMHCYIEGINSSPHPPIETDDDYTLGSPVTARAIGTTAALIAYKEHVVMPKLMPAYLSADYTQIIWPIATSNRGTVRGESGVGLLSPIITDLAVGAYYTDEATFTFDDVNNLLILTKNIGTWEEYYNTTGLRVFYDPPLWGNLSKDEMITNLGKIIVEESILSEKGFQLLCSSSVPKPYGIVSTGLASDYEDFSFQPETVINQSTVSAKNVKAWFLGNENLTDQVGSFTVMGSIGNTNFKRGLQNALVNADGSLRSLTWDGNDLAELNTDANADGFNVVDEGGQLVVRNN